MRGASAPLPGDSRSRLKKITVEVKTPYTVLIERDALAHAGSLVKKFVADHSKVVLISTRAVRQHCGPKLEDSLQKAGVEFSALEMRDGERFKNIATVEELVEKMADSGADRSTLVLALGGGVVGDVAAFVASIYMRGVNVIQIPTTLVAMIDSAIGGKTGINLKRGKNLVGTFHHPRAVLVDPLALGSLPEREYRSGLCEAIKYGIIRSREVFDFMEKFRHELLRRETEKLEWLISECVRMKAEIVVADERESDLRRILNFGHTLGHALESATEYRYFLHGEAVAWGMIAACQIAVRTRRLDTELAHRMNEVILALAGTLPPIEVKPEVVMSHATIDKKAVAGVLHFVLPRDIGRVEVAKNIPEGVIREALADTMQLSLKAAAKR